MIEMIGEKGSLTGGKLNLNKTQGTEKLMSAFFCLLYFKISKRKDMIRIFSLCTH